MKTATKAAGSLPRTKAGATSDTHRSRSPIKIIGNGKFPLVPLAAIQIVERPKEGEESSKVFFNPRSLNSFTPESLFPLRHSIRVDGLQQPPVVRAITEGKKVIRIENVAGERRNWCLNEIVRLDLACWDEDAKKPQRFKAGVVVLHKGRFGTVLQQSSNTVRVAFDDELGKEEKECQYDDTYPTVSGRKLYEFIPVKLLYECGDERALRIAFNENDQSEPLTIVEQIALVERLVGRGMRQEDIAELLGTNITFVSQTKSFREQLPSEAFTKLINGDMARHVAVSFLSYAPEDRQKLYDATIKVEEQETAEAVRKHKRQQEEHEDQEELHLDAAKKAEQAGDTTTAERERKKASTSAARAKKSGERRQRAEGNRGKMREGHMKKAAAAAGLSPKKGKLLDKDEIDALYVKGLAKFTTGGGIDPITGNEVPDDLAAVTRRTALALLQGERDALKPIRDYLVEIGRWEPVEDEPASSPRPKPKRGRKPTAEDSEEDSDEDEDEDSDEDEDEEEQPRNQRKRFRDDEEPNDEELRQIENELDDDEEDLRPGEDDFDRYQREWN